MPTISSETHPLAVAELELAEAARESADFARGMVPAGRSVELEPGALVNDAVRLVDHALRVLIAAVQHERIRGDGRVVPDGVLPSELAVHVRDSLSAAGTPERTWRAEALADSLFDLDDWVRRHCEADDPPLPEWPVTTAIVRHW